MGAYREAVGKSLLLLASVGIALAAAEVALRMSGFVFTLAVFMGGWSSEQGRRQMLRDIVPLEPRVATIYYGWNDHWVALGPEDSKLPLSGPIGWLESHLRLAQVVLEARGWNLPQRVREPDAGGDRQRLHPTGRGMVG